jgi:hypothetical protein
MRRLDRQASEALPAISSRPSRLQRDGEARDRHGRSAPRGAANPILKDQMAAIYAYCDPVAVEGYDAVSWDE